MRVTEKEQKLSKKYHMVKFFERQKLSRMISQEERRMQTATDKAASEAVDVVNRSV